MSDEILLARKMDLDDHIANKDNPHGVTLQQLGLTGAVIGVGTNKITSGKLKDRPGNANKGDVFISLSSLQLFVHDGGDWVELARAPKNIGKRDLGFEPAINDDSQRTTLDAVVTLQNAVQQAQADLDAARSEVRLMLDVVTNKSAEVNALKDRVAAVESKVPAAAQQIAAPPAQ